MYDAASSGLIALTQHQQLVGCVDDLHTSREPSFKNLTKMTKYVEYSVAPPHDGAPYQEIERLLNQTLSDPPLPTNQLGGHHTMPTISLPLQTLKALPLP